jgi:hypothetical protein
MAKPQIDPLVPVLKKSGDSHFVMTVTNFDDDATVTLAVSDHWEKVGNHLFKRAGPIALVKVRVRAKDEAERLLDDELSNLTITVTNPSSAAPNSTTLPVVVWVI